MLKLVFTPTGCQVSAKVGPIPVYLDNFALIRFACGDAGRRRRLVNCLTSGADLLFSVTNACEILGPQSEKSVAAIREMLADIGTSWVPVEINVALVVQNERDGKNGLESYQCVQLAQDCFLHNLLMPPSTAIIQVSDAAVSLAALLDWLRPQRDSILEGISELDAMLQDRVRYWRDALRKTVRVPVSFDVARPGTFVFDGLLRDLVFEKGFQVKKGDGADFCHAVIAGAFSKFAALDRAWKRRIESLPKPNRLAKVYFDGELDQMINDIEACLDQHALATAP